MHHRILIGDAAKALRLLPDSTINLVFTSPPYFQCRDYSIRDQIGLEENDEEYLDRLEEVFEEVYRVLREDGSVYINIADKYLDKTLRMIPERLLLRLRDIGFLIRNKIIWLKTTTLATFAPDRFTPRYEFIFFLTKHKEYFFNPEPLKEKFKSVSLARIRRFAITGRRFDPLKHKTHKKLDESPYFVSEKVLARRLKRLGKRHPFDVWPVASSRFKDAHEAVFPLELPIRAILASSRPRDVVLDPFLGSGTTSLAAELYQRNSIGIDLNPEYLEVIKRRFEFPNVQMRLGEEFKIEVHYVRS